MFWLGWQTRDILAYVLPSMSRDKLFVLLVVSSQMTGIQIMLMYVEYDADLVCADFASKSKSFADRVERVHHSVV